MAVPALAFYLGRHCLGHTLGAFLCAIANRIFGCATVSSSLDHWFGTTGQGQSVIAQTLVGGRPTLMVAFG